MIKNIPKKILKLFFNDKEILVLSCFYESKEILDFDLSKKTNININDLRSILQKFHSKNIANYKKNKSEKKEFWYDFIWYIDTPNFYTFLYKHLKEKVEDIEQKIKKCKIGGNFTCPDCNKTYDLAEAYTYEFQCPDCNAPLTEKIINFEKYENELKEYNNWLKKIEKYAKKEENIDLEELFSEEN